MDLGCRAGEKNACFLDEMIPEAIERGRKTISKSGQEWTLPAQLGQLKTGQDGKGLLRIHLWCPDDLPRLWDRIE